MKKLELYIETSTWNFLFADDAPDKRDITKEFFKILDRGIYKIYISEIVIAEIVRAPQAKKELLENVLRKYAPLELKITSEAEQLADEYISRGIIPARKYEDGLHVAIAAVAQLDAVITWNYQHLANLGRSERFYSVNLEHKYFKKIELITPMEVLNDEG